MKHGILLVQMGGPCCISKVEEFLFNLFKDEHIIQLPFFLKPFQKLLAKTIASKRSHEVAELYKKIGGTSPILYETQCQAKALEEQLNSNSTHTIYKTYIAMRYSYPFLEDSLEEILNDKLEKLTVIPLYPQYSTATTGSSFAECREMFSKIRLDKEITIEYIESWEANEFFIQAWIKKIHETIAKISSTFSPQPRTPHILFSAHGLPEKYIRNGDPYQKQIHISVSLIMNAFSSLRGSCKAADVAIQETVIKTGLLRGACSERSVAARNDEKITYSISYQSKVGPVKWLEPSTDQEIERLALEGVKDLIIVPVSFVGDHIETLYEIDMLYRELAKSKGIENFVMVEALKDDPLLIAALESLTIGHCFVPDSHNAKI